MNIDIRNLNNYSTAKFVFDEVILWSSQKNPKKNLESFLVDLEKLFDKVEEKSYNSGYKAGYDKGRLENG